MSRLTFPTKGTDRDDARREFERHLALLSAVYNEPTGRGPHSDVDHPLVPVQQQRGDGSTMPVPAPVGSPDSGPAAPVADEPAGAPASPDGESEPPRVIVGAAIISAGRVLAGARSEPPAMAGMWEFPGGKVEPGESEHEALIRECVEELGVQIEIGDRIGTDVLLRHGRAVLRLFAARLVGGEPQPYDHAELRWLGIDELDDVPWLPADAPLVRALRPILDHSDNGDRGDPGNHSASSGPSDHGGGGPDDDPPHDR